MGFGYLRGAFPAVEHADHVCVGKDLLCQRKLWLWFCFLLRLQVAIRDSVANLGWLLEI